MNEYMNFSIEMAKAYWDVLAVFVGLPVLVVVGLGVADVIKQVKGAFQCFWRYLALRFLRCCCGH